MQWRPKGVPKEFSRLEGGRLDVDMGKLATWVSSQNWTRRWSAMDTQRQVSVGVMPSRSQEDLSDARAGCIADGAGACLCGGLARLLREEAFRMLDG